MRRLFLYVTVAVGTFASTNVYAQAAMTTEELQAVTSGGRELVLGGDGHGYIGKLMLDTDGTGEGSARTDAGAELTITGKWRIMDGKFCRTWKEFDGGAEVCETWKKTSENSVEVFNGDNKVGVNSW